MCSAATRTAPKATVFNCEPSVGRLFRTRVNPGLWLRQRPWRVSVKAPRFVAFGGGRGNLASKHRDLSASGGAAAVRGSCASPGSAVPGSNRRAQAIHGLLAPDPRTTASFATSMSVASSCCPTRFDANGWCRRSASCTPPMRSTPRSRRTSLQGDFVRAVHGCTAPACWSRTRNHAADEIPLQRRPLPEARLLPLQRRPPPEAKLLPLQRPPHPKRSSCPFSGGPTPGFPVANPRRPRQDSRAGLL